MFRQKEAKEKVLKLYFGSHKLAKLAVLHSGLALEYRFTLNEVLSIQSFRIRNLALRLKQRKLIDSVFIRNDSVSVRLPNQKRYTPISDINQLLQLTATAIGGHTSADESSIFFDAISADSLDSSHLNQQINDQ